MGGLGGVFARADIGDVHIDKHRKRSFQSNARERGLGGNHGRAGQVGHHVSVGRLIGRSRHEQVDAGTGDALRMGGRILREYRAFIGPVPGQMGSGARPPARRGAI